MSLVWTPARPAAPLDGHRSNVSSQRPFGIRAHRMDALAGTDMQLPLAPKAPRLTEMRDES